MQRYAAQLNGLLLAIPGRGQQEQGIPTAFTSLSNTDGRTEACEFLLVYSPSSDAGLRRNRSYLDTLKAFEITRETGCWCYPASVHSAVR